MPKGLRLLVIKEVKDLLRDPKILIGMILFPALILPLMGAAINISTGSLVEKSSGPLTVYVLDEDGGTVAQRILGFLQDNNVEIRLVRGSYEEAIKNVAGGGVLMVLPEGLSQKIESGARGEIMIYYGFKEFSILESLNAQRMSGLLGGFENILVRGLISENVPGANPDSILNPLLVNEKSVIKGVAQPISPYVLTNIVRMQGLMGPLVIMIVLILAMQVAATSIAIEKEAKTLETLLTIPVSRLNILFGKLVGSVTIALLATIANVFAFTYYVSSITSQVTSSIGNLDLASVGLIPPPEGYFLLGLTLFGALVSALALALTLGTLAQDVRGAQSIIGIVIVPIFLPTIFLMMGDMQTLPFSIQMVLYAIPFTYPVLASQSLITGNYAPILAGLVYMAFFTLFTLYLAAKVFTTEKVMTGRFSFKRRRL
ncbi:MAG: ABC transporter permease [Candidatus Methanomethyliaceae archaeon]|nr:ABC transporter permease [Candidatus Methanomethyliaceae archaeon]